MKRGPLAFPALAALVLTQVMVGVAHAGGDYKCHGPGYYESYGSYHEGYRNHGPGRGGYGYQHQQYGNQHEYGGYGYRYQYGNQHEYGGYGRGHPNTGGREPSRTWKDPTYGNGDVDRSPRSRGTDFARQNQRVYPDQFRIPPGHQPPPGSCRVWYGDRPAGHQPPPGDCRLLEGLVL